MDFSKTKIRCSSIGKIMTEPQTKEAKANGELSATCKTHLISIYAEQKYGRRKEISTKYTDKGNQVEEDSITLLSRVDQKFYKKNEEDRIENDWLTGHPDLYEGPSIYDATLVIDIKSSWDIFTFLENVGCAKLDPQYKWQVTGYMDLTGAKEAYVSYCLVNTPESILNDEKYRLLRKMDVATEENPEYKKAVEILERTMIFDDIPIQERVLKFKVERDDEAIEKIHRQVEKCRLFLAEIERKHLSFNLMTQSTTWRMI